MRKIMLAAAAIAAIPGMAWAGDQPQDKAAPVKEKKICKRSAEIGRLVETRKECRTRAEWNQIADAARSGARDIVERNAGRMPEGN